MRRLILWRQQKITFFTKCPKAMAFEGAIHDAFAVTFAAAFHNAIVSTLQWAVHDAIAVAIQALQDAFAGSIQHALY